MASLLKFPRAPRCLGCLRRAILDDSPSFFSNPSRTQWRGKKKLPKRTTVQVRLLKDIAGYGRKGYIVPVAPGRMRNMWFPQGRAEYVTAAERKAQSALVVDRDHTFNIKESEEAEEDTTNISVESLSASRATEILERVVPNMIEFRRQPIQTPPLTAAAASEPGALPAKSVPTTAIYGSVTTGDIAANIKTMLAASAAQNPESNSDDLKVGLTPEDVRITSATGSNDTRELSTDEQVGRIKSLGEWTVTVQVCGGGLITRTVKVLPEAGLDEANLSNTADT